MNEQRAQAYGNLIKQLFDCNNGDEPRILQENRELVDEGLVEFMLTVARKLEQAGRENEAQWLMSVAQQLAEELGLDSNTNTSGTSKRIQETSHQTSHSVYILLDNVGTDNEAIHTISTGDNDTILMFESSADAANFARQLGEQNFPVPSVEAMESEQIFGFCQQLGYDWEFIPKVTNGIPPSQNSTINQQDTIEVSDYPSLPKKAQPTIKNKNIRFIYLIGKLLYRLGRSLIILLSVVFIGIPLTLLMLIFPSLKRKIESLNSSSLQQDYLNFLMEVLQKVSEDNNPQLIYSFLQQNLDKLDENLITFLASWAKNTLSLSSVHTEKAVDIIKFSGLIQEFPLGNIATNLEIAITGYQIALAILTFDAFPQEWAMAQTKLALAYYYRIRGKKAKNLEMAIAASTEALKVLTFDAFPREWAMTQNSLAAAYYNRIRGDKAENLEMAIQYYHNTLKIWTKENDPLNCLRASENLAILHYNEKQWQPATEACHITIEALENARLEALNPQSRQETLSNAIDVFHRIVQAHLNLNQPEKALEYIERSKGRNLVELMTQKNLHPQGVSQEIIAQLNELKQRVVNEQIRLQHQSINQNLRRSDNLTPYVQDHSYLKDYQQDLDNFIAREIKPIDPFFSLTQKVEPIPFAKIQALTDAKTCLLQWYITDEKILTFVVSDDGDIKVWQSSEEDKTQLFDTINNYRQLYYSENGKREWIDQLSNLLQTFADTLHINDILALIPNTCKRLIIIPHWFLHIIPIHALPVSVGAQGLRPNLPPNSQELHDLFPNGVQYAPSCQLLQIAQSFHHFEFNKLFAIQNPTKDLLYTDLEVNILSNFFTESQIIAKDNATKNTTIPRLKSLDNHCYHFSCHGGFNFNNPLESALFLANEETLTLGEIFELRLNKCRLVTLSACETGLIDLKSLSDEYIGLPSGFLFAGSPSVVSSLWAVNDLSTSFLMMKFYEIFLMRISRFL